LDQEITKLLVAVGAAGAGAESLNAFALQPICNEQTCNTCGEVIRGSFSIGATWSRAHSAHRTGRPHEADFLQTLFEKTGDSAQCGFLHFSRRIEVKQSRMRWVILISGAEYAASRVNHE